MTSVRIFGAVGVSQATSSPFPPAACAIDIMKHQSIHHRFGCEGQMRQETPRLTAKWLTGKRWTDWIHSTASCEMRFPSPVVPLILAKVGRELSILFISPCMHRLSFQFQSLLRLPALLLTLSPGSPSVLGLDIGSIRSSASQTADAQQHAKASETNGLLQQSIFPNHHEKVSAPGDSSA